MGYFLQQFFSKFRSSSLSLETQEQLKNADQRLKIIVDSVTDYAIYMIDPDGKVATWNDGARKIKGYEPSEVIGQHFSIFYLEEDIQNGKPDWEITEANLSGRFEDEGWRVRKDGTRFWASNVISAYRDPTGKILGYSKVTRDITEKRRNEIKLKQAHQKLEKRVEERTEELRKRENQLRLVTDSAPTLIAFIDTKECYQFVNATYETWLNLKKNEIIGKTVQEIFGNENYKQIQPYIQKALIGQQTIFELAIHFPHIGSRFCQITYIPEKGLNGELTGVVSQVVDLTHRKKAEEKEAFLGEATKILVSSLNYFENLKKVAQLAIPLLADWCFIDLIDQSGKLKRIYVSTKYDEIQNLDISIDSLLLDTQDSDQIKIVDLQENPSFLQEIHYLKESAIAQKHEIRTLLIAALQVKETCIGKIYFMRGHSNQEYSKDDFKWASELSLRAAMAIENSILFQDSQKALRTRDEFLSIASHELKTPLTSLYMQIQILERRILKFLESSTNLPLQSFLDAVVVCKKQSARMTALIDELLDLTQIRAGKLNLTFEKIQLNLLLPEIISRFQHEAEKQGSQIYFHLNDQEFPIIGMWDRVRLEQVIVNLITNAIKYGRGMPIEIALLQDKDQNKAILTVKDYGIGISPELQSRVFEKFERGRHNADIKGLGLGLYITRQIVEAHKGTISVISTEGKGSEFRIELPLEKNLNGQFPKKPLIDLAR